MRIKTILSIFAIALFPLNALAQDDHSHLNAQQRKLILAKYSAGFVSAETVLAKHAPIVKPDMQVVGVELSSYGSYMKRFVHDRYQRMYVTASTVVWLVYTAYKNGVTVGQTTKPAILVDVYDALQGEYVTGTITYAKTPFQGEASLFGASPTPSPHAYAPLKHGQRLAGCPNSKAVHKH